VPPKKKPGDQNNEYRRSLAGIGEGEGEVKPAPRAALLQAQQSLKQRAFATGQAAAGKPGGQRRGPASLPLLGYQGRGFHQSGQANSKAARPSTAT
jgi:hypothetical protein